MARDLALLRVPTGDRVLELLPALADAMAGVGPVLLPVPAGDEAETARLAAALRAGEPMGTGEDDDSDPTALVVATSGSTGTPKGAVLPASALRASAAATRRRLGPGDGAGAAWPEQWLLALPATHIAGLQVLLRAAAAGSVPVVLDTADAFTARRFEQVAGALPAGRRLTSLVPTQLNRVLADPSATAALASFDAVLVGGAATRTDLVERARAAGVRLVTTYGMSETCGGCVYDGVPLDGVTVSEVRPLDPRLGVGAGGASGGGAGAGAGALARGAGALARGAGALARVGEPVQVMITGPVVARGYRNMPGHPAFGVPRDPASGAGGDRTFRTQDLAVLAGGRWQVMGRMDDLITTGGLTVDPAGVESELRTVVGVRDVVVVGVPDPDWGEVVVAVVVPAPGAVPDLQSLRSAARRRGPAAAPRQLVVVERLPELASGKPDRVAIREAATAEVTARLLGAADPGRSAVRW